MNFPFSDEIREKISHGNRLMWTNLDENGHTVFTEELRVLMEELQPYLLSPEYDAWLISRFDDMNISLTITEE